MKSIKKVSGTLKLELAQYRSLEAFAIFASDLDAASRRQLARGARLTELLKQPQYSPFPIEEQVVSIWAGTKGKLDEVPVEDILRFERELLDHLHRNTEVLSQLKEKNVLTDDIVDAMDKAVGPVQARVPDGRGQAARLRGIREVRARQGRGRQPGADRQGQALTRSPHRSATDRDR